MAIFNEIGNGGAVPKGCAEVSVDEYVAALYDTGDVVYNIHKARKGIYERVVIKRQKLVNTTATGGIIVVTYVDTLNGLWNEDDLVLLAEAQDLVAIYEADTLAEAEAADPC